VVSLPDDGVATGVDVVAVPRDGTDDGADRDVGGRLRYRAVEQDAVAVDLELENLGPVPLDDGERLHALPALRMHTGRCCPPTGK